MKQLLIVRHAKSSWKNPNLPDFDRPLNDRGERDAPVMAKRLAAADIRPEVIISSPAMRAVTTARCLADALGMAGENVCTDEDIYEAGLTSLLAVVQGLPDEYESAILVGHNPGLTVLNYCLSGYPINNIPTCGMVHLQFPIDSWAEVAEGRATFLFYDFPKNDSGAPIRQ